ncbi:hypothetical protein AB0L06_15355 [Spirillospora sp. NPDC052269]
MAAFRAVQQDALAREAARLGEEHRRAHRPPPFVVTTLARTAFARTAFARTAFARTAFARTAFARTAFARTAFADAVFADAVFADAADDRPEAAVRAVRSTVRRSVISAG